MRRSSRKPSKAASYADNDADNMDATPYNERVESGSETESAVVVGKQRKKAAPKKSKRSKPFTLNMLAVEIKLIVFGMLSPEDLLAIAQTCKDYFRCKIVAYFSSLEWGGPSMDKGSSEVDAISYTSCSSARDFETANIRVPVYLPYHYQSLYAMRREEVVAKS
jgi:hypothetical protein